MMVRYICALIIFLSSATVSAKEIDVVDILDGRWGDSKGFLRNAIYDFDFAEIDRQAKVMVTWSGVATPEKFVSAKSFFTAFKRQYQNAEFRNNLGDVEGFDYVILIDHESDSDPFESQVPVYENESTGVDCESNSSGKISCKETGNRRVKSGYREVSDSILSYEIEANLLKPDDLEDVLRTSRIAALITASDKCRNTKNVTMTLAYLLGSRTFTEFPDHDDFTFYANQLGCYKKADAVNYLAD